jgi:tRNA(Ile)-lysidine synthase
LEALRDSRSLVGVGSVLVAASGGPDSTALLCGVVELVSERDLRVEAAHLDHAIRPESAQDRRFVEDLCRDLGVPFHTKTVDVLRAAEEEKENLEAVGRRARYAFLLETAHTRNLEAILTGHTADDTVETMLMNFLRGAGPRGLAGIPEVTEREGILVIRPLRTVRRDQVIEYLKEKGIGWREDRTNADPTFLRNWVRNELLPKVEGKLPAVRSVILREASLFEADERFLDSFAEEILRHEGVDPNASNLKIPVRTITGTQQAIGFRIIRVGLESAGEPVRSCEAIERIWEKIRDGTTTWSMDLPGGIDVRREYEMLSFGGETPQGGFGPISVPLGAEIPIPRAGCRIETRFLDRAEVGSFEAADSMTCFLDAEKLTGELTVRSRQPGDRLEPLGMTGTQKVKDILINAKVPESGRDLVPIFCHENRPVWVVGYRMDQRFRITEETKRVVRIRVVWE